MKIHKKSIIKEKVKARDISDLNLVYSCESCSFFHIGDSSCNLGYNTFNHLKKQQDNLYNKTGRLAICRFLEID